MSEHLTMTVVIPAAPQQIYEAWLSSKGHTAMTGSRAVVDGAPGGSFTAWDGYISGVTIQAEPYRLIVQRWRTTEFPEGAEDSRLEIHLKGIDHHTLLTLIHTDIPDQQGASYERGWQDFYFEPMRDYFTAQSDEADDD